MKFNPISSLAFAVVLALLLSACVGNSVDYQALPCRLTDGADWVMVRPDGTVVSEKGFAHRPSLARCDRFWSQNEQGYWELYKLSDQAERVVNKEFRYVTSFYDGRAIVAERDKPVTIIDTDGNTLVLLDSIGSLEPRQFRDFNDGLAVFEADTLQGVVSYKGELVVPAKYYYIDTPNSGRIVAFDSAAMNLMYSATPDSVPPFAATVFDYNGEVIFTVKSSTFNLIGTSFSGGYLPVGRTDGETESWGLIDAQGEVVLSPSPSVNSIEEVRGTHFVFVDPEGNSGVKSLDGSTVIKPKYSGIRFLGDNLLAVGEARDGNIEWNVVTLAGEKVIPMTLSEVSPLMQDKYLFVKVDNGRWTLFDAEMGEPVADAPRFADVFCDPSEPSSTVSSDYIDIPALIKGARMTANSLDGVTFQSSVQHALEVQARYFSYSNKPQPANYSYTNEVNIFPTVEGEMLSETVTFPSNLSHQTYRQEKVIDFVWGYTYYYHINKIPTGYTFTSDKPSKFTVSFNNYGKLRGKLRQLYNELVSHFAAFGSVNTHNGGATVIDLSNGRTAVVYLEPNSVSVKWGNLSVDDRTIFTFDSNKEELTSMFAEDDSEDEFEGD